jgi:hypothetical protein
VVRVRHARDDAGRVGSHVQPPEGIEVLTRRSDVKDP